ncbi:MAG: hypothetical protein H0T65_25455, partial [Deltaproteobacteria bacterium]|nr:hypothetical protein [Deltaproteobacteria bacterium]
MIDRYAIGPIFAVRAAGVPFEVLERLGTPDVSEAARHVNALTDAIETAAEGALARVASELASDPKVRSKVAQKLSRRLALPNGLASTHPWLAPYQEARAAHAAAQAELEAMIEREYLAQLGVVAREAGRVLPDFVLLESAPLLHEVRELERHAGTRTASQDRRRHRTLAMYLQRVCAKNDAFSRFGPTLWGTVEPGDGLVLHRREGIARRVELETWVVAQLVKVIDADPDVRPELAPRLHPHGRLEPGTFVRLDEQREITLSALEHALASRCDGTRTARELEDTTTLASLAARGVI